MEFVASNLLLINVTFERALYCNGLSETLVLSTLQKKSVTKEVINSLYFVLSLSQQ